MPRTATKKLALHPACQLIPELDQHDADRLRQSIAQHGQLEPIELLDGKILDGRSRYEICLELDVTPKTHKAKLNGADPYTYVAMRNIDRRHLSKSQIAMIGTRLAAAIIQSESEKINTQSRAEKPPGRPREPQRQARKAAAKTLGISEDTLARAERVKRDGSKALRNAVNTGQVNLNDADTLSKLPKAEQTAAVRSGDVRGAVSRLKTSGMSITQIDKKLDDSIRAAAQLLDARRLGAKRHTPESRACHDALEGLCKALEAWRKKDGKAA